ncbi:MAG: insulinase family protein [Bacteroidales bacterium]|nr:insulinase family protein [Bacteroidales bacterium]
MPEVKTPDIRGINLNEPALFRLDNGIPVYIIDSGKQDLIRLELIFNAGYYVQSAPLQALTSGMMMKEGTSNYSSKEIAETVDHYGTYFETLIDQDTSCLCLYSLFKNLENVLPVLKEVVRNPVFPEEELSVFIAKNKQQFIIHSKKVEYQAKVNFNSNIFGYDHPYGRKADLKDFDLLNRDQIIDFYKTNYSSSNCKIFISGKSATDTLSLLNTHFGGDHWNINYDTNHNAIRQNPVTEKKQLIHKEDALQSAVRIGKPLFNKLHPDYSGLRVLMTILGGYFGSRLMTNIREDKGYTYGIGSGMVSLLNGGYMFISTETGIEHTSNTLKEIYYELDKLREEFVSPEELDLVKNYMLGEMLHNFDGPFDQADRYRSVVDYGLDFKYYRKSIDDIQKIEIYDLKQLAEKYLDPGSFYEVIAGKL